MSADYPLAIVGNGVAGLSAAIYAGRANNDPIVFSGTEPGGQLTLTTDVANYPGFPDGIGGFELIEQMEAQATQFGATVEHATIESLGTETHPLELHATDGTTYTADAIIIASGSHARTLGIPGEDELMGYGVSTCATCDGAFFRGEDMAVIGGGDAALEEASFLTKFADTVHLIHRRDEYRAEAAWEETLAEHVEAGAIVEHKNTEVTAVHGSATDGISHVDTVFHSDGTPTDRAADAVTEGRLDVGAVFVAIGHVPNTSFVDGTDVVTDDAGYVQTETVPSGAGGATRTGVAGVFAAGDVVDHHYQQAVTAAGMGCQAALDADAYLNE
jgi:thioredoxin reductase (NADPH)